MSFIGIAKVDLGANAPSNIVTDEAEPRNARVCFHDATESALSILSHGVGLVENDDFVRWTRIFLAI